ncbi:MAG: hypothetical protein JNL57_05590 [Bacteroidetes bacterium]|nr:hypothetical protein [Bacteroidota bacterium]
MATDSVKMSSGWKGMWVVVLLLCGCRPDKNKFPDEPYLRLLQANVFNNGVDKDSFILLNLYYHDGDGDLGLNPGDTSPPFNATGTEFFNLHVWMYERKNGQWVKPVNLLSPTKDTLNFHERIPRITPTGRSKWVEGNLDLRIPAEPVGLKPDTVKITVQLTDRARRKSAVAETEAIVLKH